MTCNFTKQVAGTWRCTQCGYVTKKVYECPPAKTCVPLLAKKISSLHPCKYRGKQTRTELCTTCAGQVKVKVFSCDQLGECTLSKAVSSLPVCSTCKFRTTHTHQWITTAQLISDTLRIAARLPDISGVIGIARSGMLPASVIATHLHLPLYSLKQFEGQIEPLGHGYRLKHKKREGALLVIDDTLATGNSLNLARDTVNRVGLSNVLYGAVYPTSTAGLDVWGQLLPLDHLLEWNFFNSVHVQRSAFDFDGVLCEDGGLGIPKHLPRRFSIPLIVTARPEFERQQSLAWLTRHNISVERLEMWPDDLVHRNMPQAVSRYKARHYLQSGLKWFVESCPVQAEEIAKWSNRPVICPSVAKVF